MLNPVDAPVSEFKSRGINGENVSQFEARYLGFHWCGSFLILQIEIIHIAEAKATCLPCINSDKVAKKVRRRVIYANISEFGLDGNLSFMISCKATERKVAVRSIG